MFYGPLVSLSSLHTGIDWLAG